VAFAAESFIVDCVPGPRPCQMRRSSLMILVICWAERVRGFAVVIEEAE